MGQTLFPHRLEAVTSGNDPSFFYRVQGPALAGLHMMAFYPFAGAGLTGEPFIEAEVTNLYLRSSYYSAGWQVVTPATELLINYYYDPVVNAVLTAGVDYISPVKGTDELMIQANPDAAKNQFVIPPPDWVARMHIFGPLSEEDDLYFNKQFAKVIGVG